ncbi:DUF952 domain-containing protein [Tessaracoccus sp. OH4464_COT-324]|uniref:DUF952 domain-containing protein n=1 Tax=Tessaracoccus sp. OH4464_COT-324 TaxID=2491059 RepID=UPI000F6337E9|nr:DUF952 domain-containing protein [Tessaracoccus sp. OH4464_COT-324]RRD46940.1 DUF952 domain-containing protein [Tessaracoccus sp. OH4464_COT-324]
MIFHIALPEDLAEALASGVYRNSTRGALIAEVGFLHACDSLDQVKRVREFIYPDRDDVIILTLNEERLATANFTVLREPTDPEDPESEHFPHIYGGDVPVELLAA